MRLSAEELRWSSDAIDAARSLSSSIGSEAVFVSVGGVELASWGEVGVNGHVRSVRKSLMNALIGVLVAEGRIALSATLNELGVDDTPPLRLEEGEATVEHLLQSRSGIYHDAAGTLASHGATRPSRGAHGPGEAFWYNNWDFNALGSICERVTGETVFLAFARRVAEPIGMQDFAEAECSYQRFVGSEHPAYKFYLSARDMARFGLLYLQRGRWKGRDVLPPSWVDRSLKTDSTLPSGGGYGYLWWIGDPHVLEGHAFYYASGGWNRITIVPSFELVVAHRKAELAEKSTDAQLMELIRLLMAGRR